MTGILTRAWNFVLGLETPPSPPDLYIIIEPSRRDLWRFRLVNHETGKTAMVSAGRGKKTFEEALEAAQAVASADIIGDWAWVSNWKDTITQPEPINPEIQRIISEVEYENEPENDPPKSLDTDNFDNLGVPGPPITTTEDQRFTTIPDPVITAPFLSITETEPIATETEPVETLTTVGFGTYDPTEAHRISTWEKERQRNNYQAPFPKEKPYHYKQAAPTDNGETKMKI